MRTLETAFTSNLSSCVNPLRASLAGSKHCPAVRTTGAYFSPSGNSVSDPMIRYRKSKESMESGPATLSISLKVFIVTVSNNYAKYGIRKCVTRKVHEFLQVLEAKHRTGASPPNWESIFPALTTC